MNINATTTPAPAINRIMRVLQFGDSLLPVGAFSFSNGLESAIQQEVVHDVASLRNYIQTVLDQAATSDGVAVLAAFRAAHIGDDERIDEVDHAVYDRKLNEQMRLMTVRMGRKLAEMADGIIGPGAAGPWLERIKAGSTPGCYPVAQGLVFASLDLSEQEVFAVHQYGLASMIGAASLRLMKVHYLDVQAILFELAGQAEPDYHRVAGRTLDDMCAFAPGIDVLAAAHVQAKVRMFMN